MSESNVEFREQMIQFGKGMSSQAVAIVGQVLQAEHKCRFSDRSKLPEIFAIAALKTAKSIKEADQ